MAASRLDVQHVSYQHLQMKVRPMAELPEGFAEAGRELFRSGGDIPHRIGSHRHRLVKGERDFLLSSSRHRSWKLGVYTDNFPEAELHHFSRLPT